MEDNSNNFEWTRKLVQQCIDDNNYQELNKKDKYGWTGFMLACWNEYKLAEIMLERNDIDFNIQDNVGYTGFIWACINQPELAEIMLEKDGIDFNTQDNNGYTRFMTICELYPELMKQMLNNNKIDKTLKSNAGLTGYDIAKKYNKESFEIYEDWLAEQEKNHINTQVQKRTKKPSKSL